MGNMKLQHRVVLPPLTRFRADKEHVPLTDLVKEYYVQRSQTPGTLIVTEGVFIRPEAGGYDHVSGIWNKEQIASWKKVRAICQITHTWRHRLIISISDCRCNP